MARTYVPGLGYVDSSGPGTRGSIPASGRPAGGVALTSDHWNNRDRTTSGSSAATGTTTSGSSYRREGVATSRLPMPSGVDFTQRMGYSPDAFERFPYGVRYTSALAGTASWYDLTPAYRDYITSLSKHPNIGSTSSTGRMLWERMNTLSADHLAQGENISAQMLVAQLAGSVGIGPDLGAAAEQFPGYTSSGGGGYGSGGGGGGAGGGQVSLTNPTSARGLLMQTMQGVLGRDPTNSEYKSFIKVLNESEMANPQTVSFEGDTAVGSGGVDPGFLALEFAQDQEDFRERQGDQYFRTFMTALAGGV